MTIIYIIFIHVQIILQHSHRHINFLLIKFIANLKSNYGRYYMDFIEAETTIIEYFNFIMIISEAFIIFKKDFAADIIDEL